MRLAEHERSAERVFGQPFSEVHRFKDTLAEFCGPVHRALPPHDPLSDLLIGVVTRNPTAGLAGIQHGIDDFFYTVSKLKPPPQKIFHSLHRNFINLLSLKSPFDK